MPTVNSTSKSQTSSQQNLHHEQPLNFAVELWLQKCSVHEKNLVSAKTKKSNIHGSVIKEIRGTKVKEERLIISMQNSNGRALEIKM